MYLQQTIGNGFAPHVREQKVYSPLHSFASHIHGGLSNYSPHHEGNLVLSVYDHKVIGYRFKTMREMLNPRPRCFTA